MTLSSDDQLKTALQLENEQAYQKAEKIYKSILKADMNNVHATLGLGRLAQKFGHVKHAMRLYEHACKIVPNNSECLFYFIECALANAMVDEAKSKLQSLKNIEPMSTKIIDYEARIKKLVVEKKKHEVIVASSRVQVDPTQEEMRSIKTSLAENDMESADVQISILEKIYPNSAILFGYKGIIKSSKGFTDQAILCFRKSISLQAKNPTILYNLGNAYLRTKKYDLAVNAYEDAIKYNKKDADFFNNLANAYKALGEHEKAIVNYRKAINCKNSSVDQVLNLANLLIETGDAEQSLRLLKQNVAYFPKDANFRNVLGNALRELGEVENAKNAFIRAVSINKYKSAAHFHYSQLHKYKDPTDHHIALMNEVISSKNIGSEAKCHLRFALGKAFDDIGHYEDAFKHYCEGNKLRKTALGYQFAQDVNLFERLKKISHQAYSLADIPQKKDNPIVPIFIVGMPRSGTSLVEQIISTHSEVSAGGELPYLKQAILPRTFNTGKVSQGTLNEVREQYLHSLNKLTNHTKFITDKMPHNFRFVNFIIKAFPEAKIVHVYREPAATCWSNFKHYFGEDGLGYSYDLDDLCMYYRSYVKLMDHWDELHPDTIYHVNYDELVNYQIDETVGLLENLGLAVEAACFEPHKNKRVVRTASQLQVKEKIYQGSSQSWLNYKRFLGTKFDFLPRYKKSVS